MSPLNLVVNGARGRMGEAVIRCAEADERFVVLAAVDLGDDLASSIKHAAAVIDFSHAEATESVASVCAAHGVPLVVGTTGHSNAQRAAVETAGDKIPLVLAPNFSVGVNTLFWLTRQAARILGPDFDLEVVEMHHRLKKDAPSGTARRLGEILAEVRDLDYDKDVHHGREGMIGERPAAEIGMHALRGGDVVGDHTVVFAGEGERVELTHRASSRDTFAQGALRAALWVVGKSPGLYDMQDVLNLRETP